MGDHSFTAWLSHIIAIPNNCFRENTSELSGKGIGLACLSKYGSFLYGELCFGDSLSVHLWVNPACPLVHQSAAFSCYLDFTVFRSI